MGGFCPPPGLTDFKKPGLNRVKRSANTFTMLNGSLDLSPNQPNSDWPKIKPGLNYPFNVAHFRRHTPVYHVTEDGFVALKCFLLKPQETNR